MSDMALLDSANEDVKYEWMEIGERVVPAMHRDAFLNVIQGRTEWGLPRWVPPVGSLPMSPGLALQLACDEFGFKPREVSYNLAYEYHDTTLEPGDRHGDYTATATLLGLRLKSQIIWIADVGVEIVPILLISGLAELAPYGSDS